MGTIKSARAFLVDLPVETERTDAVQSFVKQETIFCELTTDDGLVGLGYSYTIGNGGTSVLAMLNEHLLPQLVGKDASRTEALWHMLFSSTRATTVGAITSLALAAADIALWDLKCLAADLPLWVAAGGFKQSSPVYDTEGGWLHLDTEALVAGAEQALANGLVGIKMKVGKPSASEDAERVAAVRSALGPHATLLVDANQSMTYPQARQLAHNLEPLGVGWLEEPLPAEDITGHRRLADSTSIPIAVGESLYSAGQFAEYIQRGAAGVIQVDVARVGGITPWLKVAHMAEACNLKVSPHFLMEIHVSLVGAVPNGMFVEHIPQLRSLTNAPIKIIDGEAVAPDSPGIGIDWNLDSIDDRRIA